LLKVHACLNNNYVPVAARFNNLFINRFEFLNWFLHSLKSDATCNTAGNVNNLK